MAKKTTLTFNRIFAKPKPKKEPRYFRKTTMTDEELLKLREELNITPNDKTKPYRGGPIPKPL